MRRIAWISALLSGWFLAACAISPLERALDPDSREFLSRARYLITKEERESFLKLPPSERQDFVAEFWKKRDPTPDTEENEFRDRYFRRIEEANRLFKGEGGGPGWLQDRGRIYILLGQPSNRETYPRGMTFYGQPTEVWYYNFFPIVFIDYAWNGDYKLAPLDADQIAMINAAQIGWKPQISEVEGLNFHLELEKTEDGRLLVRLLIPYQKIWMKLEGQNLQTSLTLDLQLLDSSGKKIWEGQQDYSLSLTEQRLDEIKKENYVIEVPIPLKDGAILLDVSLTNTADGSKAHKKAKLNF